MPRLFLHTSLPDLHVFLNHYHQHPEHIMKPVISWGTKRIDHEGAPLVYMNPAKPARNLSIIYEAIKDLPDSAILQADHDQKGLPYVFFPERPKASKKKDPVKQENLMHYREELRKILGESMAAAKRNENNSSNKINANAIESLKKIAIFMPSQSDFTAGQLRPILAQMMTKPGLKRNEASLALNKSTATNNIAPTIRLVSPSKPKVWTMLNKKESYPEPEASKATQKMPEAGTTYHSKITPEKLLKQRLNSFVLISEKQSLNIKWALFGANSKVSQIRQDQSIEAMIKLVADYVGQLSISPKPIVEFIVESDDKKNLECFAMHWLAAIKAGKNNHKKDERFMHISIHNWTPAITALSQEIVKNLWKVPGSDDIKKENIFSNQNDNENKLKATDAEKNYPRKMSLAAMQGTPFKERVVGAKEDQPKNLMRTSLFDEKEPVAMQAIVDQNRSDYIPMSASAPIASFVDKSSLKAVVLPEHTINPPLRQPSLPMPVIAKKESTYFNTAASDPELSEFDLEPQPTLLELAEALMNVFEKSEIYSASPKEVESSWPLSTQENDADSSRTEKNSRQFGGSKDQSLNQ
jgi:hypothetical protein